MSILWIYWINPWAPRHHFKIPDTTQLLKLHELQLYPSCQASWTDPFACTTSDAPSLNTSGKYHPAHRSRWDVHLPWNSVAWSRCHKYRPGWACGQGELGKSNQAVRVLVEQKAGDLKQQNAYSLPKFAWLIESISKVDRWNSLKSQLEAWRAHKLFFSLDNQGG